MSTDDFGSTTPGGSASERDTLSAAEHPYRVMVEAMSDGAVVLAANGTIVYANPGFAALIDMPLETVIGSAMARFVAHDDVPRYTSFIQQNSGVTRRDEIQLTGGGGAIVPVEISISGFESVPAGSLCATVTNLREHKHHEELVAAQQVERGRRAEAEQSQHRVEQILESITDAFFSIDRTWRITRINQRAAAVFGKPPEELVGRTLWDIAAQSVPETEAQYRKAMTQRIVVHHDGPSILAAGKWFEKHIYPTDEGLAIYFRDITERKQVQELLRRSEANLAESQRLTHTGSWRWNVNTGECVWSLEQFRIFGLDPETFHPTKDNTQRFIHPEDLPAVEGALSRSIHERTGFEVDYRLIRADGSLRYHHGVGHPTVNAAGEIEFVGSIVDMTDWHEAEERLLRSEALLAAGERISHMGSWALNLGSGQLVWSAEHYRVCGVEAATFTPSVEAGFRFIHPDDRQRAREVFERALRERAEYECELRIVRTDGTVRHCLSMGRPVFDADGGCVEFIGTIMDMTDRKEEETVREELRRRLVASQEDERRRIAREMHDQFGQQLSALALKLSAMKRDSARRTALAEQLGSLESIVRQLDRDLEDLVGRLRPMALDDLGLTAALTHYVKRWSEHFDIPADLNATGIEVSRMTDEINTALYRITQEALNNVAKHAHATHVDVLLDGRPEGVSLIIEDDGVGFRTADSQRGHQRFGIVGMRERALLLGGTLDIESRPGHGTTVVARLPLRPHSK